jgi:hypothetical protein
MLGELCGLDVLILAAGHDQPVSALAVMLPSRDQTGLMCSKSALRDPLWAYQRAPELVEPRALSALVLLRWLPSRGGLGRVRQGSLTGRLERVRVEARPVDLILLVYYCGHTGQTTPVGRATLASLAMRPARIRLGPVGS